MTFAVHSILKNDWKKKISQTNITCLALRIMTFRMPSLTSLTHHMNARGYQCGMGWGKKKGTVVIVVRKVRGDGLCWGQGAVGRGGGGF